MRIHTLCISAVLSLVACGGKPTAPETPDPEAYGKTIQPFHKYRQVIMKAGAKPGQLKKNQITKG